MQNVRLKELRWEPDGEKLAHKARCTRRLIGVYVQSYPVIIPSREFTSLLVTVAPKTDPENAGINGWSAYREIAPRQYLGWFRTLMEAKAVAVASVKLEP